MNKILILVAALGFIGNANAAPAKSQAVLCIGEQAGAHTLVIGNCSFEGLEAQRVIAVCKKESDVCQVEAHGRDNGHGIVIIDSVESVKLAGANPPLSTQELAMAKRCKARKACSLTCNRVAEAGRHDLIEVGACAE
jgi:hypothetical protein